MTVAAVRARIKTTLDTVSNVGKTHDYPRWAAHWDDLVTHYKTTISTVPQVRGWAIDLAGWASDEPHLGRGADQIRVYSWRIDGWHGVDDSSASVKVFDTLAESVCNAIDADATLNARGLSQYRTPCQLALDFRMFGSVLCRHAEITFSTAEVI